MSITTYAELQTAIGNWLDRNDLSTRIPEFIAIAEADIFDDVRIRQMQTRADITIDSEYENLPTGFQEVVRFHIDASPIHLMEYKSPEQLNAWVSSTAEKPDFYTIIGTEFQFNATPGATYTGKLVYYKNPGALTDSNTSNVVLASYPNIYLYGSLVAAEPYLGNDERVTIWKTMYRGAVEKANKVAKKSLLGGAQLQMSSSR